MVEGTSLENWGSNKGPWVQIPPPSFVLSLHSSMELEQSASTRLVTGSNPVADI